VVQGCETAILQTRQMSDGVFCFPICQKERACANPDSPPYGPCLAYSAACLSTGTSSNNKYPAGHRDLTTGDKPVFVGGADAADLSTDGSQSSRCYHSAPQKYTSAHFTTAYLTPYSIMGNGRANHIERVSLDFMPYYRVLCRPKREAPVFILVSYNGT
jgi:hypothetical protein